MSTSKARPPQEAEKSVTKPASMPSIDGYNLTEFPIFPLVYQTDHLTNTKESFRWIVETPEGEERECWFHRKYGDIAPNGDTVDYLLLLIHLLQTSDDPLTLNTNFHEIITLKPFRKGYKPSRQYKEAVIRHLDALQELNIHTNAVFNRKRESWEVVKTNVLNYKYEDQTGRVRTRKIRRRLDDDTGFVVIESHEEISELSDIHFSRWFIEHFVDDHVFLDLAVYFSLEYPTSKGIFRIGNRHVQSDGGLRDDLMHFCGYKLGMSRKRLRSLYPSQIKSRLRSHVERVNETVESMRVVLQKTPSQPSGYEIIFDKPSSQVSFFPTLESFTERERKAHNLLRSYGVFPNASASLVRHYRKRLGREAPDYIQFVVKRFREKYIKTGQLRTPQEKWGGVLHNFFKCDLYFAEYADWAQQRKTRRRRDDQSMYDKENPIQQLAAQIGSATGLSSNPLPMSDQSPVPDPDVLASKHVFSRQRFEQEHPELYQRIVKATTARYDQAKTDFPAGLISDVQLEKQKQEAIEFYCKQCFNEFKKGNTDYFPPILADEE